MKLKKYCVRVTFVFKSHKEVVQSKWVEQESDAESFKDYLTGIICDKMTEDRIATFGIDDSTIYINFSKVEMWKIRIVYGYRDVVSSE